MAAPSTTLERRGAYFHSLSKVLTNETQYPFESKYKSSHSVSYNEVWAENIPYCETSAEVDSFITSNPGIIQKYTEIELTEIPGSNGQAWYINDTEFIKPFISPVDIMDVSTGLPSSGFEAKLYKNNGTQISPTSGVWFIDYYAGIVHFQFGSTPFDLNYGIPKLTVYVYTGKMLSDKLADVNLNSYKIKTTAMKQIIDNTVTVQDVIFGDIVGNVARVYDTLDDLSYSEYTCYVQDGVIIFDSTDELDGKYAIMSYLTTYNSAAIYSDLGTIEDFLDAFI